MGFLDAVLGRRKAVKPDLEKLSNPRREQTVGSGRRLRIRSIRNDAVTIAHRREKFDRRPSDPPTIRGAGVRHHPA